MIIAGLADIHNNLVAIEAAGNELKKADLVLIAGDITNFGGIEQIKSIIETIRKFNGNILAIHGNCDRPDVKNYLEQENISLHRKTIQFGGITFAGLGGVIAPPTASCEENNDDYDMFADYLDILSRDIGKGTPFVFVSHQGACATGIDDGIGSLSIRKFIEKTSPILALSGHSHEAVGVVHLNGTVLANPGPTRKGKFVYAEIEQSPVKLVNCQIRKF